MDTKNLVIGGLLAVIAALFQIVPALFSEVFIVLTIFSALPVYIVSRMNPEAGVLSYLVASLLIILISTHEGLFFLCTNGVIGISLGICNYYTTKKTIIWIASSLALTVSLSAMNYGIGIPVFGTEIPGGLLIQLAILFLFSLIYNIIYNYFSGFIFRILNKSGVFRR